MRKIPINRFYLYLFCLAVAALCLLGCGQGAGPDGGSDADVGPADGGSDADDTGGDGDADGRDVDGDAPDVDGDAPDVDGDGSAPFGIEWVAIPAGSFEMGCSAGDLDCPADELPRHTVTVSAFEMTRFEITQEQYLEATGANPSEVPCPRCPVDNVSWDDAAALCEIVGGQLPSEAQWEHAARGGTETKFYCGNDNECLETIAWYYDNADQPNEVGLLEANGFGLHDMLGNVYEWVADCLNAGYHGAPNDGSPWLTGDCSGHFLRGGCWDSFRRKVRVSNRNWEPPPVLGTVGIRCVR